MVRGFPSTLLQSLLIDGVWKGVQSVLVFLPQILLLFLFIGVLEDSGYLARAALIADRAMRAIGLNGKAFIPLLSAYACAVPAIMATRTIENKRDRIATILVAPFMTCSARLPIYMLIIAAFIPNRPMLGHFFGLRACVMLSLYLLGFLAALGTARLLKSSMLKSSATPFILELPQYRWPTLTSLGLRLYDRARVFLYQAGTIIVGVTIALWILGHLPMHGGNFPQLADSAIGKLGQCIEPVIRPLGFNWKIGIGLLTSVLARETIVGTLGTLYGADSATQSLDAAECAAPGHHPGRCDCADCFLRLRDAVHFDHCGGAAGNQQLEVAGAAVQLHAGAGLHGGICHKSDHHALVLIADQSYSGAIRFLPRRFCENL